MFKERFKSCFDFLAIKKKYFYRDTVICDYQNYRVSQNINYKQR